MPRGGPISLLTFRPVELVPVLIVRARFSASQHIDLALISNTLQSEDPLPLPQFSIPSKLITLLATVIGEALMHDLV